ncbi:pilus assembly protein TadG-related protein [Paenibacillus thermotolerans]|uniref:pilus assembly protein TadG-related protein n=1 Tax=Paenibacillus thermotolerans TaxID=3027807 RepID=UPI002368586C|nr:MULTISPECIES: pilus assembly protein TadG-related protein [unclassified Paenibacillus]
MKSADWLKHSAWKLVTEQKGNVIAVAALSMVAMLAIGGLVVDGGSLYVARMQMQKAANAAALSGAQELTTDQTSVEAVARHVLHQHKEEEGIDVLDIRMKDSVTVGLTREVPLGFAGIFGIKSTPVSVSATAQLGIMGEAKGAAPIGIDDRTELVYNQIYTLKVEPGGQQSGFFGILALDGPGASTYSDNLRYGYKGLVKLDDIIDTQTGNIAGKTREAIEERIRNCPYPEGEMHHRDCPRVLLVPVYKPYDQNSNQLKKVRITGFAYFYVIGMEKDNDTYIKGKFIERVGTGIVDPGAAGKGAFSIRLTE